MFSSRFSVAKGGFRRAHQCDVSQFTNQLDLQVEWSKRGANLVMHSADIKLVSRQLMSDLAYIRKGNGDAALAEQEEVEGV